jgi:amino acid adenylation domain-containing protein
MTPETFQVSPQQGDMWAAEPDGPAARTQSVLRIDGAPADVSVVEDALRAVVRRHESLRTTFERQPGLTMPVQVVHPLLEPRIERLELSDAEPREQAERMGRGARSELEAVFDLDRGPLVRATLVTKGDAVLELILTVSALCIDQASMALLLAEVASQLAAADLVEDPLQYADFSAWQAELRDSEDHEEARSARAFWEALGDVSAPALPFTRPSAGAGVAEEVALEIDPALADALGEQSGRHGTTPAAFAHAGWHAVLGRFSGAETTAVAFVPGERRHADLEGALGAFAHPVPVQIRAGGARPFAELLADVVQARGEALVRQDYAPSGTRHAVEIGFVEYPLHLPEPPGMRLTVERMLRTGSEFGLLLMCGASGKRLTLSIAFDPVRYRREAIRGLADGLVCVLEAFAADPHTPLADVPLVREEEARRLLRGVNDTAAPVPQECAHELVARWAVLAAEREAVVDGTGSISYAELEARANQLAHRLRARGVGPDVVVGLCSDRSIEMVVGLLGILKAGGAYVPLHYEHPPARLRHQLVSAGARLVLTQEPLLGRLAQFDGEVFCLDRDRAELEREPSSPPQPGATHQNLAYVIYTSGSTGAPKGVAVTHGNLVNYAGYIIERLDADGAVLTFGLLTSISTDLGNTSLFGALCSGGTLVLISPDAAADPAALASLTEARPLDVLKITPSHVHALLASEDARVLPRRWLVVGGERVSWDLIDRVRALSNCSILNHYGPTETTVGSCTFEVDEDRGEYEPSSVPIGRPIFNTSCYVLDDNDRPTPVGVAGKLFIAGAGVARGYIGQPELTAERFSADPLVPTGGARMYDTGDLARWLPDDTLEFLGRVDEQVKLRGYRVEPAEIETALRSHPRVREAVALTQPGAGGDLRLVAYCAADGEVDEDQLRAHLADWLPEFMLPHAVVILAELPRTPSGKIDKLQLPEPGIADGERSEYLAPRTPVEEAVAAIWIRVLGVAQVGVEDDFFALGGHSLLATQVVAQVRSGFAVDLPLHSLFTCPTVASLSAEIVRMMGDAEVDETDRLMAELEGMSDEEASRLLAEESAAGPTPLMRDSSPRAPIITPRPNDGPAPLSSPQERLFLLDRIMPGLPAYNVPTLVRVDTTLDANLLRAALNAIVSRHEILRTSIRLVDGAPVQEVEPAGEVELTVADLRSRPQSEREDEWRRILGELASRSFDLAGDVLLHAGLVHLGQDEDLLLIVLHHIASDHASNALLFAELDQLYGSLRDSTEPVLPELPVQYPDFARWQREELTGSRQDELLEYWTKQLTGAPARLELPADRPRPGVQSYHGRLCEFVLASEQVAPLHDVARAHGASLFMVLLAAFKSLIHRYTGVDDVVLGSPVSGRQHEEIASLLGFFSNTLVLRTDLSGDPSFAELLERVRLTTLEAREHQELPFEKLVEVLNPERSQSYAPIFQVLFGFDVGAEPPKLAGHTLEQLQVPGWRWSRFDLSIVVRERADGSLRAQLEYATDLFDAGTIERLVDHYKTVLAAVASDPQQRLSALPVLTSAERARMLVAWNATARAYDRRCLHEQFADQAARRPDAIAVADARERISYGELDRRSNQLARELVARGVGKGTLVAICMDRCVDLLVAMLGVLRAGAAYVPIEPTYPPQRQELLIADAGAPMLITQERYLGTTDRRGRAVVSIDRDRHRLEAHADGPLQIDTGPDALAYVIYTSGSTGEPKGVEVRHRSAANLLAEMRVHPGVGESDVVANLTTPAFDLSVPDWYLPLTSGARLVVVPREATLDGVDLADWLVRMGATIVQATPTTWQMLIDTGWQGSEQLKVVCGGEALTRALAQELLARSASVWHMYGPTETTVWSSAIRLPPGDGPPPLGGPTANTTFYVLDANRQPVPVGVPGELYIGGDGLARGYHGRPELTAEKFVENPFARAGEGRLYRTGDLMRWRESGTLEFLGRSDQQVKLRGFRIELHEIESVLGSDPAVAAAVVSVREDSPGDRRLVAYVVPADHEAPDHERLRRLLRSTLPPFMVPSMFVTLERLPVTPNGKLDRASLPAPDGARPNLERPYAAPEGPVEQALASIWREVLGLDRVGRHDDFFDLGGHSLLAVKMLARVHDSLGVSLALRQLFDGSTMSELAGALTAELLAEAKSDDVAHVLAETTPG